MKKDLLFSIIALSCACSVNITDARAWNDQTHLAIAKVTGYPQWYNAAGPDIAKIKAGLSEERNHYSNNIGSGKVMPAMVLDQIERYNRPDDAGGHLYGAIIASLRAYRQSQREGKYAGYHLAYCCHYIGDLSQPLHNAPHNGSPNIDHGANDGIVENEVMNKIDKIARNMSPVILRSDHFEKDLAKEIARMANSARALNDKLQKDNRNMSKEEAYRQLGQSASLFMAVLNCLKF